MASKTVYQNNDSTGIRVLQLRLKATFLGLLLKPILTSFCKRKSMILADLEHMREVVMRWLIVG